MKQLELVEIAKFQADLTLCKLGNAYRINRTLAGGAKRHIV